MRALSGLLVALWLLNVGTAQAQQPVFFGKTVIANFEDGGHGYVYVAPTGKIFAGYRDNSSRVLTFVAQYKLGETLRDTFKEKYWQYHHTNKASHSGQVLLLTNTQFAKSIPADATRDTAPSTVSYEVKFEGDACAYAVITDSARRPAVACKLVPGNQLPVKR